MARSRRTATLKVFTFAIELYNHAIEELGGLIEVRQTHVDFSQLNVTNEFTKAGQQITSAAAYDYRVSELNHLFEPYRL